MKKVALVLSGGGALGAAHIGALKALEKKTFQPDFFAGVSAGAIIAALAACGKSGKEIEEILKKTNFFSLAFDFSTDQFGILRGEKIKKMFAELFEERDFTDLTCPLYIGATDFGTGKRVIIHSGKIADAVRASISVPVLFAPFYHKGEKKWLADGGLTQNFPLDLAIEHYQGKKIIGIDVAGNFPRNIDFTEKKAFQKIKTLRKTLERTMRIIFLNQQNCFPADKRVQIIRPPLFDFTGFDLGKLDKIIKIGEQAVLSSL